MLIACSKYIFQDTKERSGGEKIEMYCKKRKIERLTRFLRIGSKMLADATFDVISVAMAQPKVATKTIAQWGRNDKVVS